MIETMKERLERLMEEVNGITAFMCSVKCKSSDGMICTLQEMHIEKKECPKCCTLPEWADSEMTKEVLRNLQLAETNKFLYSCVENVAIKADTITRIWAELEYNEVAENEAPTPN